MLKLAADWNADLLFYPLYLVNYISLDYIIKANPEMFFTVELICMAVALILVVFTISLSFYSTEKNNSSSFMKIVQSIISFMFLLFKTILELPYLTLIFYSFTAALHPVNL